MEKSLRKYKNSIKGLMVLWLSFLMFLGSVSTIYFGFTYKNDHESKITLFILSAVTLILFFYFYSYYKSIPKLVFFIGENHLEVLDEKTKTKVTYKFSEIGDVFLYSSGSSLYKNNLVFRINPHTQWYHVKNHIKDFERFSEEFMSNYFKYKTPILLDKIEHGEQIEFRFLDKKNRIKSSLRGNFNKIYKRIKTKSITLDKNYLVYEKDSFSLKDMESVNDTVLGFIEFKDNKGQMKFKIHEDNFFSLEVFLALYDCVLSDYFVEKEICKLSKKP